MVGIVNTGDDTVMHGLSISPDLDTITYTLAGAIDPVRGWGLADETWRAMEALQRYAAVRPAGSARRTDVVQPRRPGPRHPLLPHRAPRRGRDADRGDGGDRRGVGRAPAAGADDRRAGLDAGRAGRRRAVSFQEYFVKLRHSVPVRSVRFDGAAQAALTPGPSDGARRSAEVVVIAPSNPLVSIGPIRALPASTRSSARVDEPSSPVSPIVGGAALKGPADRMLVELGHEPSVVGVARLYAPIAGRW